MSCIKQSTNYFILIILIILVLVLFGLGWWFVDATICNVSERGLFGDKFGSVNALFSGLAFAGLIFTIILQKKELALQREELSQTREELKGQKEQLTEQNKTLRKQTFENTFFHMMELQQKIVDGLYAKEDEEKVVQDSSSTGVVNKCVIVEHIFQGRNLFAHKFANSIHNVTLSDNRKVKVYGLGGVLAEGGFSLYERYYTPTNFDHYFRHFYTILKFIDKNDIPEREKRMFSDEELYGYAKILRATLSRYELVWLFYNGLSEYGKDKLKPLIEKYCMLKNLRIDLLVCSKENFDLLTKAGLSWEQVSADGFSGTDFEFFLTKDHDDKTKYHISAFFKTLKDQSKAEKLVNEWNDYLEKKRNHADMLAATQTNQGSKVIS